MEYSRNWIGWSGDDAERLSLTIDFLRFPLIVGVVFIHNYIVKTELHGVPLSTLLNEWTIGLFYAFSQVVSRVCVPLFFFISGLLFFKGANFSWNIYVHKIRRRISTLLVPYLIWNLIGFLLLCIASTYISCDISRNCGHEYRYVGIHWLILGFSLSRFSTGCRCIWTCRLSNWLSVIVYPWFDDFGIIVSNCFYGY